MSPAADVTVRWCLTCPRLGLRADLVLAVARDGAVAVRDCPLRSLVRDCKETCTAQLPGGAATAP